MKTTLGIVVALLTVAGCHQTRSDALRASPGPSIAAGSATPATVSAAAATLSADAVVGLAVSAASLHAWTRDGSVWRWETDIAIAPAFRSLARIRGLGPVRKVVAGQVAVCALGADGTVSCWRESDRFHEAAADPTPRPIEGLRAVRDLAAGDRTLCAINGDGAVWCWGRTNFDPEQPRDDRAPVRVEGSEGAVEIAVGASHGCLRAASGEVRCWGRNSWGELGVTLRETARATPVPSVTGADSIAVSHTASCARTGGRLVCWGAGYRGVTPIAGVEGATALAMGSTAGFNENAANTMTEYVNNYAIARMADGRLAAWSTYDTSFHGGDVSAPAALEARGRLVAMWSEEGIDGPFDGFVCTVDATIRCWSHEETRVPPTDAPLVPFVARAADPTATAPASVPLAGCFGRATEAFTLRPAASAERVGVRVENVQSPLAVLERSEVRRRSTVLYRVRLDDGREGWTFLLPERLSSGCAAPLRAP